jgi:hypothetical protein
MASLAKMCITKIMEIGKEGIWNVSITEKKTS